MARRGPSTPRSVRSGARVVRIGGCPRSGSTMLELLLANRVGGVAIGEARRVFDRGILGNERCACGQPFWSCEWWGPVVLEAFGSREAAERVGRRLLDAGLLTMWTFPALRFRPGRTARLAELRDAARRVFDACATRADGRWLSANRGSAQAHKHHEWDQAGLNGIFHGDFLGDLRV